MRRIVRYGMTVSGNEQGFLDPRCGAFGGHAEDWTCRFRYMPWDNLIEKTNHIRTFAEVNGSLDSDINYHVEGLWSQATIPDWLTTPSFPPFPFLFNGVLQVALTIPVGKRFASNTARWRNTRLPVVVTPTGISAGVRSATRVRGAPCTVSRARAALLRR